MFARNFFFKVSVVDVTTNKRFRERKMVVDKVLKKDVIKEEGLFEDFRCSPFC